MVLAKEKMYTIDYIYDLPDGQRAELIDGQIYDMAPPGTKHQRILSQLHFFIMSYIKSKNGKCEVFPAPFAVFLNKDDSNYFEPDISIICDLEKLDEKGCHGAPEWIIEIVSPGNPSHDYVLKLNKYMMAGVKEYWIVDYQNQIVTVYYFTEDNLFPRQYNFQDKIKVNIYDDFIIDFNQLNI